jgi:hypothetical protein
VVRVQILIGWSIHVHGDGMPRLPKIDDVESVLNFVTAVMNGNEWKTLKHILQTQYEIDEGFTILSSFRRTLLFLKDTLLYCDLDN